jgi:hypothetical protein
VDPGLKSGGVGDEVVGRNNYENIGGVRHQGSSDHSGCSVTTHGFDDDLACGDPGTGQGRAGQINVRRTGDHDGRAETIHPVQTVQGEVEEGPSAEEGHELFGKVRRREGPESGPRASREDDWSEIGHSARVPVTIVCLIPPPPMGRNHQ